MRQFRNTRKAAGERKGKGEPELDGLRRRRSLPLLGTGVAASGHDERDVPRISDVGNEEHEY
jgi:hypothetical protein